MSQHKSGVEFTRRGTNCAFAAPAQISAFGNHSAADGTNRCGLLQFYDCEFPKMEITSNVSLAPLGVFALFTDSDVDDGEVDRA